jgi:hypothetical protein
MTAHFDQHAKQVIYVRKPVGAGVPSVQSTIAEVSVKSMNPFIAHNSIKHLLFVTVVKVG